MKRKQTKKNANKKAAEKPYNWLLKDIEWPDQLSMKWKEKGIASHDQRTSEERSTYFTFSEIQISPKKEMEVNTLFLIIKAKLPATTFHQQEKKWI